MYINGGKVMQLKKITSIIVSTCFAVTIFGIFSDANAYLAYIILDKTNKMALLDSENNSIIAYNKLPVKGSHGVTYSPDKKYLYINAMPPGDIVEFDIAGNGVSKWYPQKTTKNCGILVAPDGKTVISASQNKKVILLNRITGESKTIDVPSDSHQFTFRDNLVWVAGGNGNAVHAIDWKKGTYEGSVNVGKVPHGLTWSPDGSKVLVSLRGENRVAIYDAASFNTGGTAKESGSISVPVTEGGLCNITLMPDNKSYWVAETFARMIHQIDVNDQEVIASVKVDGEPHHVQPMK